MAQSTDEKRKYPKEKILSIFKDWFQAEPSIYPPNLNDMVEWKAGKISLKANYKVIGITTNDYNLYKAVDAKYSTIVYEFVPMGMRQAKLEADGDYVLKIKKVKNPPWSFGSCHSCWKKKNCSFRDTAKTPRPYDAKINNPNLSVMGGCGHIICNGCILGVEK